MVQTWTDDTYEGNREGAIDLQNIENNFSTLKSLWSGGSTPSNIVPGFPWFDTTKKILKIRNQADTGWLGVMYGNISNKIWMYSNSATDGWAVAGGLSDCVLAIKGGSRAYNVNGGNSAGTWSQPPMTLTIAQMPAHTTGSTGGDQSHNHGNTYRPFAAIGTLQYPNP